MLQRKRAQKTKIQKCVLRGMIRGKSQGSLPKAEGVIIFYTPRNKPALGLVVHGVTRHHPWRMCWAPCMELKALGSSHGVLLGGQHRCEGHRCEQRCEQHRCEGSVPLGGCRSPGVTTGHQGWSARAVLQAGTVSRHQHTAHCPLPTQGCFISLPAQQVCLREEFAYKPRVGNNKWPFPESFL